MPLRGANENTRRIERKEEEEERRTLTVVIEGGKVVKLRPNEMNVWILKILYKLVESLLD